MTIHTLKNSLSKIRSRKNHQMKSQKVITPIPIGRTLAPKCASRFGYWGGVRKKVDNEMRQPSGESKGDKMRMLENDERRNVRMRSRVFARSGVCASGSTSRQLLIISKASVSRPMVVVCNGCNNQSLLRTLKSLRMVCWHPRFV